MKPSRHRRGVRFLATTIVVLSLAGGIAYATIPYNGNVFTACIKKVGTIRLIDPSLGNSSLMGHCTALETQIKFNEQGQDLAALQAQVTALEHGLPRWRRYSQASPAPQAPPCVSAA